MIVRSGKSDGLSRTREMWSQILIVSFGIVSGISIQLNRLADSEKMTIDRFLLHAALGTVIFAGLLWGIRKMTGRIIERSALPVSVRDNYKKYDTITYAVFLLTIFGAIGIQFSLLIVGSIIFIFLILQLFLIYFLMGTQDRRRVFSSLEWLTFLFLISGFAALIYQIVWQRSLFTAFGVNIESITIIVSIFMFGLGIGSLAGGFV